MQKAFTKVWLSITLLSISVVQETICAIKFLATLLSSVSPYYKHYVQYAHFPQPARQQWPTLLVAHTYCMSCHTQFKSCEFLAAEQSCNPDRSAVRWRGVELASSLSPTKVTKTLCLSRFLEEHISTVYVLYSLRMSKCVCVCMCFGACVCSIQPHQDVLCGTVGQSSSWLSHSAYLADSVFPLQQFSQVCLSCSHLQNAHKTKMNSPLAAPRGLNVHYIPK